MALCPCFCDHVYVARIVFSFLVILFTWPVFVVLLEVIYEAWFFIFPAIDELVQNLSELGQV